MRPLQSASPWLVLFVASVLGPSVALAQTAPPQPWQGGESDNPNDISNAFNNRGSGTSMLNLINQLQLSGGRTSADFAEEQDENLKSAVDEFRQKQMEQLQGPMVPSSNASPTLPAP